MGLTRALGATATRERPRLEDGALVGSSCKTCGARSWPARAVCSRCGGDDLGLERLPHTAQLLSFTSVWVSRGAFETPYVLGQADFGDGAIVFGHVRGLPPGANVPLPVHVVVAPAGDPLEFWFEPDLP